MKRNLSVYSLLILDLLHLNTLFPKSAGFSFTIMLKNTRVVTARNLMPENSSNVIFLRSLQLDEGAAHSNAFSLMMAKSHGKLLLPSLRKILPGDYQRRGIWWSSRAQGNLLASYKQNDERRDRAVLWPQVLTVSGTTTETKQGMTMSTRHKIVQLIVARKPKGPGVMIHPANR